ncbi:MAG TPA: HAMP domain-containing sensor histidine kinase, partial [Candidatus Binatia bacterium]|nr:HAMP domain-containing sensor histidine kinase [Candidatus Binatia bacterium]
RSRTIVGSMGELVSDLLELSRLESGTLGLEARPVSIHEVGAKVLNGLEPIAIHRGVGLRSDLPPRLRTAIGDRRRVEQIVTNLAGNAVKFSPVGGSVEIAGWFDGPVALVAVRDDGRGIEPEDRLRIFERFYRMSDHERVTGTGLGLPIARDLARAMGGDLGVASVPGSGSTFLLALPASTAVPSDDVVTALARAMATEEMKLEERAVLRAIQTSRRDGSARRSDETDRRDETAGRSNGLPLPRVLPPLEGPVVVGPRGAGSRPVRLRSIDGSMARDGIGGRETRDGSHSRPDTPSPA